MSPDTDRPVSTTLEAADTDTGDGTYVPPMLLLVFGLPIFLTLIWFFLRFTAPDRFGRVDRDLLDDTDGQDDQAATDGTDPDRDRS